jgi:hypothetical protein
MMAAFFYPLVALEAIVGITVISVLGMVLVRAHHRGQLHMPHWAGGARRR